MLKDLSQALVGAVLAGVGSARVVYARVVLVRRTIVITSDVIFQDSCRPFEQLNVTWLILFCHSRTFNLYCWWLCNFGYNWDCFITSSMGGEKKSIFIHSDGSNTSIVGKPLIKLKVHWIQ